MGNKFAIAVFGLAVLWVSQSWAGTTGNGSAQPIARTHYTYCFGGLAGTGYFSPVIAFAPAADQTDSSLGIDFGAYLTKTLRVSNNGGQCFTSDAMADAVNGKKQREAELVYRKWKIVETKWAGSK